LDVPPLPGVSDGDWGRRRPTKMETARVVNSLLLGVVRENIWRKMVVNVKKYVTLWRKN